MHHRVGSAKPFQILIVENILNHVYLLRLALEKAHFALEITVVEDLESAIEFFCPVQPNPSTLVPDLVLLLAKKASVDVLAALRDDPKTSLVPALIVSFSGSDAADVIRRSIELGADGYIQESIDTGDLDVVVACIEDFYRSLATPPTGLIGSNS